MNIFFNFTIFHFRYIYGRKISLEEYDNSDIIKILVAASELNLQELIIYLQSFLIEIGCIKQVFKMVLSRNYKNLCGIDVKRTRKNL